MHYQAVTVDRTLLVTLEYGADLAGELAAAADAADVASAWFVGWGAVEDAELAYYDQDAFEWETVTFEEPLSMPLLMGSVSREAGVNEGADESGEGDGPGDPAATVTAVFSRPSGQAVAGRVERATVFGGEAVVQGFAEPLSREPDDATGMERLAP
jgi:hypothetical protein